MPNLRRRKKEIGRLLQGRFHSPRFWWRSQEERDWDNMVPVGREFGSKDFDRLMALDALEWAKPDTGCNLVDQRTDSVRSD